MASSRVRRNSLGSTLLSAGLAGGLAIAGIYLLGRVDRPPPLPPDEGRIPLVAYEAYVAASAAAPTIAPDCAVDWTIVAALAQMESAHGRVDGGELLPNGDVQPPIRGAALDGTNGTEPMPDSDAGELDGDPTWDRAVGPLQFIPRSWRELGRDGNADGVADPNNLYDAALSAAAHLCIRSPGNYADRAALREAFVTYNESGRYADEVLAWVDHYRSEPLAAVLESPEAAAPE